MNQQKHKDFKLRKGLWSPEEDEKLSEHIVQHGHSRWSAVPKLAGLQRSGKSCRLRWINYLRPELKREKFSLEEERLLIQLHKLVGNRWAYIATHMPGRTDNDVKNHWNSRIRKKVGVVGIGSYTPLLTSAKEFALQPMEQQLTGLHQNSKEECDLYGQHLSMDPVQQMQMLKSEEKLELGACNSYSSNSSTSLTLDSSSSCSDCRICGGQCCLEQLPVLHHVCLDDGSTTAADQGSNQPNFWDIQLP